MANRYVVVIIRNAEYGKNKYWLELTATIGLLDRNRSCSFSYCGTDLSTNASLQENEVQELRQKMNEVFGFAPYNLDIVKRIIGKGKEFTIGERPFVKGDD